MWKRYAGYFVLGLVFVAGLWVAWTMMSELPKPIVQDRPEQNGVGSMSVANIPDICDETVFEGARAIPCVVDPSFHDIRLV